MKIIEGNIFNTKCQTVVNTVNCVGVMGKGIAFEFRLRYPEMCDKYVELCNQKLLAPGLLWLYKSADRWILNFPTKIHWKYPSKEEYLEKGLQKFVDTYHEKQISSIAFPMLGANNGGLKEDVSLSIMEKYLSKCKDIDIEIYKYKPDEYDDLFVSFKDKWLTTDIKTLAETSGMRSQYVKKLKDVLEQERIFAMNQLLRFQGIGEDTLQKAFKAAKSLKNIQLSFV